MSDQLPKNIFHDTGGDKWTLVVTVRDIRDVKQETGVDLYSLFDDGAKRLSELMVDLSLFVDVLYVLCRSQCEERGLTDEQFGRLLAGDSIEKAIRAFGEALVSFFPNPRIRRQMATVLSKMYDVQEAILDEQEPGLAKFGEMSGAEILTQAKEASRRQREPSGTTPESSESTPTRSASAS